MAIGFVFSFVCFQRLRSRGCEAPFYFGRRPMIGTGTSAVSGFAEATTRQVRLRCAMADRLGNYWVRFFVLRILFLVRARRSLSPHRRRQLISDEAGRCVVA